MAFAQDLFEGFANAAGDTGTVNRIEKDRANKLATKHEELAAQTQSILADVSGLQQKRAQFDKNSPTYDKDIAANDQALHDARQTLTDLYHPEQNPGALAHLGGFIRKHLGGGDGGPHGWDEKIRTPGAIKEDMVSRIAGLDAASVPSADAAPDKMKAVSDAYQKTFGVPIPDDKKKEFFNHLYGGAPLEPKAPHVSDYAQGLKRFVESEGGDPDNPTAAQEQAYREQRKGTAGGTSKFAQEAGVYENHWGKKIKDWSPEQLTYFNQKMAFDAQHSGASTTTKLEKDEYGNIRPVEVTTTHGPSRPPVEPGRESKSVPRTAGEAKARVARPAGSSIKVGEPLPFTATTPAITKAQTDFQEATKLASVADQVAKKPDDAINQKRLAVALERASAGRFTTQALDYIKQAGWGNTIEEWVNKPGTGALPPDIVRQFVEGAHQNLQGAKDALVAAHGPTGGAPAAQFKAPAGAPAAPQQDGHKLKANGQVIAVSKGGQWVAP